MRRRIFEVLSRAGITALALSPGLASASIVGFLGNFDVINDTGRTAHGFQIELEGPRSGDITDTFGGPGRGFPTGRGYDPATAVQRYGAPTISEYSNGSVFGTKVTYMATWDGNAWDFGTPSGNFVTPGDNCWTGGGVRYGPNTPCDHFGVGTRANALKTTYRWLLQTATPGVLAGTSATLPAPVWDVIPAPPPAGQSAGPPVVVAMIQAPEPEAGWEFGEALWVKVFTTELEEEVEVA